MILSLLMWFALAPKTIDKIPTPVCQPWETVMIDESMPTGSDTWTVHRKWCELDSNKAFPRPDAIIRQALSHGASEFETNFWKVKLALRDEMDGDCYFATYDVLLTNFHHFKPYRNHYTYQLSVETGDCGDDKGWMKVELREAP